MEPGVLEPADNHPSNESPPPTPNRVQALLGIACALAIAAGLGLPGLDVGTSYQILLVIIGFRLARLVHRCPSEPGWRVPMILGLAGRTVPTVILVVVLVALYQGLVGRPDAGEVTALAAAVTFTSNIIPFATGSSAGPIDHLWAVALVAQVTILAPWLLTAKRDRIDTRNRAGLLLAGAMVLTIVRMVFVTAFSPVPPTDPGAWLAPPDTSWVGAIAVWTSLDALLIGLAVGTLPLATLHRHPTAKLVTPVVAGTAILLATPALGRPVFDLGLRLTLAAVFTGIVLAAEAISSLPGWLSGTLSNPWWHRLGSRTLGLYLWHIPFAHSISGGNPFDWQGPFLFLLVMVLTLAAATTTYRSIEIPAHISLARLASRWYRPDTVVLPRAEPQRGKWMRWDDLSLDSIPVPARRRVRRRSSEVDAPEPLGRRLWQLGDRAVDLRPGRLLPGAGSASPSPEQGEGPPAADVDRPAAAG